MIYQSEDDVFEALSRKVPEGIDEAIWNYLVDEDYVDWVLGEDPTFTLDEFVEKYRRLERMTTGLGQEVKRSPRKRPARREIPSDERLKALSRRAAREAAERDDVKGFRETVLGGNLLSFDDVGDWVTQQAAAEGPPTRKLNNVHVPKGHKVEEHGTEGFWVSPPLTLSRQTPAWGVHIDVLQYGTAGKGGVMRIPVARGGSLDQLREISGSLEHEYRWQGALATIFVLTGLPPEVPLAVITPRYSLSRSAGAQTRIILDLDPSQSPKAVADIYRRIRADVPPWHVGKRYRSMSSKHISLAEFFDAGPEGIWRERMKAWNSAHPEWRYTEASNFARDCKHAWRRLFGEGGDR